MNKFQFRLHVRLVRSRQLDDLDDGRRERQGTLDRTRKERLQLWFRNLVNSPAFDMFFAFVVLTNSVFLGIEVEAQTDSSDFFPPHKTELDHFGCFPQLLPRHFILVFSN